MFLKRMELIGFKSFADRTELEFVPGVTAVVGPNGSGKSNISDAIRWVLGEQSAKSLRGGKMEDVIFAGSDSRKAVNYCEVSLTLDNQDQALPLEFSEVTVARRVYRSGEGEYFINKQACRLKDIVELFMDTGLGKEAYSIIGQGRIDEILSNKAEDRRGIFEEAAGIVKYKARKREAEKKLDETSNNLLRISDIISELENQIGPMFEQSEKAKLYKQHKADLEKKEIALYVYDIEQLNDRWNQQKQQADKLQDEQTKQSAHVSTVESQYEQFRWQAEQLDKMMEESNKKHVEVVAEYEKAEGRREVLQERLRNLTAAHQDLQAERTKLVNEQAEKEGLLAAERDKLTSIGEKRDASKCLLDEKLASAEGFADRTELEAEIERIKGDLIEKLNETAGKRNEQKNIDTSLSNLQRRMEKLQADETELRQRLESLQQSIESGRSTLGDQRNQEQQLVQRAEEIRLSSNRQTEQKERLMNELRQLQTEHAASRSRHDLLNDMRQEYDGFSHGVRTVLQAAGKGRLQGVHGAVAELLKVPTEYETAIETALGGALQNIVVETEKAGRDAILFLKSSGGGRATFMPLDVMKSRILPRGERNAIENHPGYVGIAAEMIRFDDRFRSIAEYLLGQVVIAKTIQDANQLARILQYRTRIVTLDGDVVNPGGSMTGGSQQKKGTSLLGRQREIEEMAGKIKRLSDRIAVLQNKLAEFADRERQALQEQESVAEQLQAQREQLQSTEAQVRELDVQIQSVNERLQLVLLEMEQYQKEASDLERKQEMIQAELETLAVEVEQMSGRVDELQQVLKQQQTAREDVSEEVTELKVQLAGLEQEFTAVRANVSRLEKELALTVQEMSDKEQEAASLTERIEQTESEWNAACQQLSLLEQRKEAAQKALDEELVRKQDLQKRMADEEHKVREARLTQKNLENQLHEVEVKLNRLDVELNNALSKLAEEYRISFELAKERYPVPEDPSLAKREAAELRRKIESLGTVNLGAIEEYARMQERLGFLSEQRDDLLTSKEKLQQVIAEIDEEMGRRFQETFTAIREQFQTVFSRLFGGGRADLVLVDPQSPLTTGIDIMAQPPGKKLQNLGLLSGGERALTAMALLFAILHVKPVPFCVLDEVEAALDEANVFRFAEYLREFAAQTQFICITHRKGTMENADVLYGVTMEESGVSKLMSVKLLEQDEVPSAS
ncbi:chromosome segregation protein SMC [Effusibacillus dendaii]|uniref:chromosome segregation protein SMC n=1 Tax=Effusibacillus dendaii TaxID=2743772 RepID=UPI00190B1233|nr:chromosome segregation protein SMC [Effusibacillus dendaii]